MAKKPTSSSEAQPFGMRLSPTNRIEITISHLHVCKLAKFHTFPFALLVGELLSKVVFRRLIQAAA